MAASLVRSGRLAIKSGREYRRRWERETTVLLLVQILEGAVRDRDDEAAIAIEMSSPKGSPGVLLMQ
jgi:hypothetical protein